MAADDNPTTLATLGAQMQYLRSDVERQAKLLQDINSSLKSLTAVEIHQQQILGAMTKGEGRMDKLDARLSLVEQEMPGLQETRKWVVGGVLATVGMMALSIFQLTVLAPMLQSQASAGKPRTVIEGSP